MMAELEILEAAVILSLDHAWHRPVAERDRHEWKERRASKMAVKTEVSNPSCYVYLSYGHLDSSFCDSGISESFGLHFK